MFVTHFLYAQITLNKTSPRVVLRRCGIGSWTENYCSPGKTDISTTNNVDHSTSGKVRMKNVFVCI